MKAILEFNLPEDNSEHLAAIHGFDYWKCLWDIDQWCRSNLKHGNAMSTDQALEEVRQMIGEWVNLEEIE